MATVMTVDTWIVLGALAGLGSLFIVSVVSGVNGDDDTQVPPPPALLPVMTAIDPVGETADVCLPPAREEQL